MFQISERVRDIKVIRAAKNEFNEFDDTIFVERKQMNWSFIQIHDSCLHSREFM